MKDDRRAELRHKNGELQSLPDMVRDVEMLVVRIEGALEEAGRPERAAAEKRYLSLPEHTAPRVSRCVRR